MDFDPGSSRIFISYRREDSAGHVLALLPALRSQFGADRIFKDTDNIPPGVDFVKFIKQELESCSVLLAIIGRDWLTVQDPRLKVRRLDSPTDFLRLEVATALKSERIRVIPVLVERGVMPAPEDLPPDLADLPLRNALELSDIRWESDVQRLIQAIQTVCAAPAPPAAAPVRSGLLDLQKRRAREIATHLQAAQEAFEAHDYEATLWSCEKALVLDPQGREAGDLLERARTAIDGQKIAAWLAEAQQLLSRGDVAAASELIDQALSLDNTSEPALALRQELLRLRREREQDRERARVAHSAVARARASLDEEDFDAAVRHADDALALEPESAEALEIRSNAVAAVAERRRLREHKRRAQQTVSDARAKFAAGQHEEALRLLLEFSPAHELVTQTLGELKPQADAVGQRQRQITESIKNAAAAVAGGHFQDAVALLREAGGLEPGRPDVAALLTEAETGLGAAAAAARARQEADARLSEAAAKFQEQDYRAARQLVEAARSHDSRHPEVGPWLRRIEDALAEQAAASERRAAMQAALAEARVNLERGDFEAAIDRTDAALAIEPADDQARTLRARALAERRKREEHEQLARQTIVRARRAFNAEDRNTAIELLERFSPPHALVSQALAELREQIQGIAIAERRRQEEQEEAKRRQEAERAAAAREEAERAAAAREAAERAAAERKQAERAAAERRQAERAEAERKQAEAFRAILARGQMHFDSEDFEAALRDANEILSVDPRFEEARKLRSAVSTALEQRIRRAEQDRLAEEAAAKARAEAEEADRQRREAEARAREQQEAELRQEQARQERIQEELADAQAAFAARKFRQAKRKAAGVLKLAPDNDVAQSLLASATQELDAATPEFWSPARLSGLGSAAAVLLATGWFWYGGNPSDSQPPSEQTSVSAPATSPTQAPPTQTPPTQTPSAPEPIVGGSVVPAPTGQPVPPILPANKPAPPSIPPANEARLQRLVLLREAARRQYQNGQRTQALDTAAEGLQIDPKDTTLQGVLDSLLRDAQTSAQRAKEDARGAGAASLASAALTEAQALEDEAVKLQAANRKDPATRTFWKAADRFALAAQQAKANRPTQPPVAVTPPVQPPPPSPNVPDSRPPSTSQPASPEPSSPPLVSRANEEALIRATLQQYERAYDTLSVDEVQRVYPSVQVDALRRAFGDMRSYDLGIRVQRIEFSQDALSATVLSTVTHNVRPRAGAASQQTRTQTFTLQKRGNPFSINSWVIVQVR